MRMSNVQTYRGSKDVRELTWQARIEHPGRSVESNVARQGLVKFEQCGKQRLRAHGDVRGLGADCDRHPERRPLHQETGSDPELVIGLRGTMVDSACLSCAGRRHIRGSGRHSRRRNRSP
jgi:NAD-dependent deacetylase